MYYKINMKTMFHGSEESLEDEVFNIIEKLSDLGFDVEVTKELATPEEAKEFYGEYYE